MAKTMSTGSLDTIFFVQLAHLLLVPQPLASIHLPSQHIANHHNFNTHYIKAGNRSVGWTLGNMDSIKLTHLLLIRMKRWTQTAPKKKKGDRV